MPVTLDSLVIGNEYDRPELARLWGYETFHALGRGVVTPRGQDIIVLFITLNQQPALPQYENRFDGELLWIDGEEGHRADSRLAESRNSDHVYLFYREKDHTPFRYSGEVWLVEAFLTVGAQPSRFVFTTRSYLPEEADRTLAAMQVQDDDEPSAFDTEGQRKLRLHIVYERSRKNRSRAIKIHGCRCQVCDFDFDATYGPDLASSYIEIHHLRSITEIAGGCIDPALDLAPLCANCHRMAHRRRTEIVPLQELKSRVERLTKDIPLS